MNLGCRGCFRSYGEDAEDGIDSTIMPKKTGSLDFLNGNKIDDIRVQEEKNVACCRWPGIENKMGRDRKKQKSGELGRVGRRVGIRLGWPMAEVKEKGQDNLLRPKRKTRPKTR